MLQPDRSRSSALLLRIAPLALLVAGCGGPSLEGTVVDPWERKLADATVTIEGVAEEQHTDDSGVFTLKAERGASLNLLAVAEGYIRSSLTVRVPRSENVDLPQPKIVLYPDPGGPGFYAIGSDGYERLDTQAVHSVGTDLSSFTGISDTGPTGVPGGAPMRVVFETTLRRADISRLDLRLTRLEFVDHRTIKDVYGDSEVTVNLWVPTTDVPFDITGMGSADDYLITSRGPLEPGAYAFHVQGVLTDPDLHHLERMPREMRVAYPFEIR